MPPALDFILEICVKIGIADDQSTDRSFIAEIDIADDQSTDRFFIVELYMSNDQSSTPSGGRRFNGTVASHGQRI